jgi:hypothetical protein
MNLQEDIQRIQEMMGVITEDRMDKVIKNMIDSVGLETTFKMVGDYDLIDSYLTDEDKINYIKDQFMKINDGNYIGMEQIWQRPIQLDLEDGLKRHQIEGLHRGNVSIVKYKITGGDMKYYRKYEELPSEIIDKLFRMMLGQYIQI